MTTIRFLGFSKRPNSDSIDLDVLAMVVTIAPENIEEKYNEIAMLHWDRIEA